MGQTATTWRTRVRTLLGEPGATEIADGNIDDHVKAAVRQFSKDRPRIVSSDYAGDGLTYDLARPVAWVDDFSYVAAVEYPIGYRPSSVLDLAEVSLQPNDSAPTHIRLNSTTPGTGYTARVFIAVPWPVPTAVAGDDKIPDTDFEAVAKLAASFGARQLSARTAGTKSSTLGEADLVDHESESDRWRSIARDYQRAYNEHVGDSNGETGASVTFDWDTRPDWPGRRFLFRDPRR